MPMWSYLGTLDVASSLRGTAYAATGVAAMISPFIVGMIADRFFATQKFLVFICLEEFFFILPVMRLIGTSFILFSFCI